MHINPDTADFWFVHNNSTVAMRPNPDGRFAEMVMSYEDGKQKAWVFRDAHVYEGRPIPLDLKIAHGSWTELDELKTWLRARGLTWANTGREGSSHVPFSNGCRKYTKFEDGSWDNDYADYEYASRRDDSPRMAIEAYAKALGLVK